MRFKARQTTRFAGFYLSRCLLLLPNRSLLARLSLTIRRAILLEFGMRLSVNSDDAGCPAWLALKRRGVVPVVTVDGVKVRHCFTADTKRGIAVVADLNEDGRMQLDTKRGEVKRKVLAGNVAIEYARQ